MAGAFRWYQTQLTRKPILTQALTTAGLFATGDVLAQQGVEKVGWKNHKLERTRNMALYGGFVFGPAATLWYKALMRISVPGSPNGTIVARVLTDQTVFASTNLFVFLSTMSLLEGSDPMQKIQNAYVPALQKNWMVWPPVQFVNFKYVPLEGRVLVVNIVSIFWNCYLSYVNSGGGK